MPPLSIELPHTTPDIPILDGKGLPPLPPRTISGPEGRTFRRVTEKDCLLLGAANAGAGSLVDEEQSVPQPARKGDTPRDELRHTLRYYTALELRNRGAADALERFFQLAEAEARTDLLRSAFPIIDPLLAKAQDAKSKNVRYPLDPADLERQRSQLLSQLEQAELVSRLINLDLKRRIGLPYSPADERLWPAGDFTINASPINPDEAATAAAADRPELRGLRAFHAGLTTDTMTELRELLHAGSPLLGAQVVGPKLPMAVLLHRLIHKRPDPATFAELEARRKQLTELIAERERLITDEARAAALALNAQRVRATLARDRLRSWDQKLADAVKKRAANQPGAEFLEPQVRMEWLKAKSEMISEVAAWHRARVRYRAALGWLVWEAVGTNSSEVRP
jgi:hypothetical protein